MLALYESDPVSAAALVGVPFDRGTEGVDEDEGGVEQAPIEDSGPASRATTDNDDAIVTRAHSPSQNGNGTAEPEPSNEVYDERRMPTAEVAPPPSSRRRIAAVAAFFAIALAIILWLGTRPQPQHAATIELDAGGETIATREQAIQPDVPSPGPTTVVVAPSDAGGLAISAKPVKPAQPIVAKARLDAGVKEIPTAADVAKLYAVVGRELSTLEATKGMEATIDLWPRYRWIRINEWITTPERRSHVSGLLERLRLDIKAQ
jgi:hypothetical protein